MARPTINDIKTRLVGSLRASLGLIASPRRTLMEILANAFAGQAYLLYTYGDNLFSESHPLNATGSRLDQWGEVFELPRNPASFAEALVTVNGVAGSRVESGAELKTARDQIYFVEEMALLDSMGVGTLSLRSRDIGADQNLAVGDELNFTSAISGVENRATVSQINIMATDPESDVQYRDRIVQFFRRSTWNAGGIDDYISWALANVNVRYAWVAKELNGVSNQVGVFVLKENDQSLSNEEISQVQEYINARAPVTARPLVSRPTLQPVAFNISIRENNLLVQEAVQNNLKELFARSRFPRGTINSDGTVNSGIVYISQIREAVSQASGEEDNVIHAPTRNLTPDDLYGILAVGEIEFQDLVS